MIARKILLVIVMFFLSACTAPGTNMNVQKSIVAANTTEGKLLKTQVIPINGKLLANADSNLLNKDIGNYNYQYLVGPTDILNIIVWNHPELTVEKNQSSDLLTYNLSEGEKNSFAVPAEPTGFSVSTNGNIYFPLIGEVKVSGFTTTEISQILSSKLLRYIRNPQINVSVAKYNSQLISVMGEVMQPCLRPITDRPLTILDGINYAGGINPTSGDSSHIYVFRGNLANLKVYWLNAQSPEALVFAQHFRLAANDIIYVPPVGISSWNRVVSQILPTIQAVWFTRDTFK